MKSYEELLEKCKEWREWYYDGDQGIPEVAKSTEEAFNLINATLFGHIYQRPKLEGKIRSLCTVAALIVLDKPNQLSGHITGALNYGWTKACNNGVLLLISVLVAKMTTFYLSG